VEWLLAETIEAARRGKVVKKQSFDKIIIDTTVMEKAVAHPTDSRLLERGRLFNGDITMKYFFSLQNTLSPMDDSCRIR